MNVECMDIFPWELAWPWGVNHSKKKKWNLDFVHIWFSFSPDSEYGFENKMHSNPLYDQKTGLVNLRNF